MILVDPGYFIALADDRDQLHSRALRWSVACKEEMIVTEYVLMEVVNHLSKPMDRDKAHDVVSSVRSESQFIFVPSSTDLLNFGLDYHRRHSDKAWSLTDCISFYVMNNSGIIRALAFDHHFQQAGFQALLRLDP